MLKAAAAAAAESGPDVGKRIHQRHFVQGIEDVMAAKSVMRQSIFDEEGATLPAARASGEQQQLALALQAMEARLQRMSLVATALGAAALLAAVGALIALALR